MVLVKDDIFSRVSRNIQEVCGPQTHITPTTRLTSELGVDSLKIAELSIAFENEFGVSCFLPDLLSNINPYELTVSSLVTYVEDRIKERR